MNPQDLGGARMAALAFQPHVAEFLDVIMHDGSLEFRLEEVKCPAESPLAGQTLRSARIHDRTGTLVLAMRHPGREFRTNPPPTAQIAGGGILIVIGDSGRSRTAPPPTSREAWLPVQFWVGPFCNSVVPPSRAISPGTWRWSSAIHYLTGNRIRRRRSSDRLRPR